MKNEEKTIKAFANRRRLEILRYLKARKRATVGQLAKHIKLSFKSTSKHLAVLAGADLVEKHQISLSMVYSIAKEQTRLAKCILENI